jgi:hypothetical protein
VNSVATRSVDALGFSRVRLGAVLAAVAAVALMAWIVLRDGGKDESSAGAPVAASIEDLKELSGTLGHPVYWAGEREGSTYELTRADNGNVFIRYLPAGTEVGDERPGFLTVGTYPYPNAFSAVRKASRTRGAFVRKAGGGGLVVSRKNLPRSVYLAYPRSNLLLEVYDPSPQRARRLVLSGQVRPVG